MAELEASLAEARRRLEDPLCAELDELLAECLEYQARDAGTYYVWEVTGCDWRKYPLRIVTAMWGVVEVVNDQTSDDDHPERGWIPAQTVTLDHNDRVIACTDVGNRTDDVRYFRAIDDDWTQEEHEESRELLAEEA